MKYGLSNCLVEKKRSIYVPVDVLTSCSGLEKTKNVGDPVEACKVGWAIPSLDKVTNGRRNLLFASNL